MYVLENQKKGYRKKMEIDKSTPELLEREKLKVTEAEVVVRRTN